MRPICVRGSMNANDYRLTVWWRVDHDYYQINRDDYIQLASLLLPFKVCVVSHRPDWMDPATYITIETCGMRWAPGIGGRSPQTIERGNLISPKGVPLWSPSVPFVCYLSVPNVWAAAHEIGHMLGMMHNSRSGNLMGVGPGVIPGARFLNTDQTAGNSVAKQYADHWFSPWPSGGGWLRPKFFPLGMVGVPYQSWEIVTRIPRTSPALHAINPASANAFTCPWSKK